MRTDNVLLEKAILIATAAHSGQKDKGGNAYIGHPKRVASQCKSIDEKIVAVLHDTIEDTDVTAEYLLSEGFPQYIVDALLSVTKRGNEPYDIFVMRAKQNQIGKVVKMNDLLDNMDLSRIINVTEEDTLRLKKYINAIRLLID